MHSLLIKKYFAITIKEKEKKTTSMTYENYYSTNQMEMVEIFLSLSNNLLFNVSNEKTTKAVWDKLQSMYKMTSTTNKFVIMKRLYKLKMKGKTSMLNHINELNTHLCQENSLAIPQHEKNKVVILLYSILNSWDHVVISINTFVIRKNKLVYDEVVATLLSEDMRRRNKDSSSDESLMVISIESIYRMHHRHRSNFSRIY